MRSIFGRPRRDLAGASAEAGFATGMTGWGVETAVPDDAGTADEGVATGMTGAGAETVAAFSMGAGFPAFGAALTGGDDFTGTTGAMADAGAAQLAAACLSFSTKPGAWDVPAAGTNGAGLAGVFAAGAFEVRVFFARGEAGAGFAAGATGEAEAGIFLADFLRDGVLAIQAGN